MIDFYEMTIYNHPIFKNAMDWLLLKTFSGEKHMEEGLEFSDVRTKFSDTARKVPPHIKF